ncbi:riboflavin synthase [Ectothiorhodospiraceae bacterium BW-2]|nr:riboflavin synthase [Ectothiorhodospiraceae bacterium BW-2]
MFTGIIETVGRLLAVESSGRDRRFTIATGRIDATLLRLGDSVAVNGVCLTVERLGQGQFEADISAETLHHTTLGRLKSGDAVNLEQALTLSTRLGGHLVSGHVDGVGEVLSIEADGRSQRLRVGAQGDILRYLAPKGSVAIDGASLTVTGVDTASFSLNIVPHTAAETTLNRLRSGSWVNIEVDLVARYLERLLYPSTEVTDNKASMTEAFLATNGYWRP